MSAALPVPIDPLRPLPGLRLWSRWQIVLSAAVLVLLWFAGLGGRALGEPDEGRYAEVAREMFISGDWITPRLNGFHFFDKPALHYWATSIFYSVFGVTVAASRLWAALCGLFAVLAIGWAARRLYDAAVGWTTVIVSASTLLFAAGSHTNTLDVGVAAFLTIAVCLFLVAQFDPRSLPQRTGLNLLGWASLALAVLSKGLIGVVLPALTLGVFMLWERDWRILRQLSLGRGLLVLMLIAAPWFIAVSARHPDFLAYFFLKQHFARFLTSVDDRGHAFWYFVPLTLAGLFPWIAFLPLSRTDWRRFHPATRAERFLWSWVIVVLVFFSVSRSKLPLYILPLFPALSLLLAKAIVAMPQRQLARRCVLLALLALVAAGLCLNLRIVSRHLSDQIDFHPAMWWLAPGLVAFALLALAVAWWLHRRRARLPAITVLGAAALLVWQIFFFGVARVIPDLSAASIAAVIRPNLQPETEVFTVNAYTRGLAFYLQRLVTVVQQEPDDIAPGYASRAEGTLPSVAAFEERWRRLPRAIAVIDPLLLPQLQDDDLPLLILGRFPNGIVIERALPSGGD